MHTTPASSVPLFSSPDASITSTPAGLLPQPQARPATPILQEREGAQAQMHRAMHSMINSQNDEGETVLMMWASQGNIRMVKLVLENGGDPSLKNRLGQTALDLAAGHDDVIALLRQHN